jgi:hypothetical protein
LAAATRWTRLGCLALGHEQPRLSKAFGLQLLLDPLRKAIEDVSPTLRR